MTPVSPSTEVEIDVLSFDGATLRSTAGAIVAVIDPDGNLDVTVTAGLAVGMVLGNQMTETLLEIQMSVDARRAHLPPQVAKELFARVRDITDLFTRYEAIRP